MTSPATSEERLGAPSRAAHERTQPSGAPVLVTEQQVLFGTAAVVRRGRTAERLAYVIRGAATALHGLLVMPTARPRKPVILPRSHNYFEASLISRERARL